MSQEHQNLLGEIESLQSVIFKLDVQQIPEIGQEERRHLFGELRRKLVAVDKAIKAFSKLQKELPNSTLLEELYSLYIKYTVRRIPAEEAIKMLNLKGILQFDGKEWDAESLDSVLSTKDRLPLKYHEG